MTASEEAKVLAITTLQIDLPIFHLDLRPSGTPR
jgi:hypothetical protein